MSSETTIHSEVKQTNSLDIHYKENVVCHERYNPHKGITIVARTNTLSGVTSFGVAKAGLGQRKSKQLGLEIAHHRCEVKPYSIINSEITHEEFNTIADVLEASISMDRRFSLTGYKRID